ncbi:beta-lactamase-like protein [Gongronella butleri]|nr:beta-lactamase-like protein [Gongronella butleri]
MIKVTPLGAGREVGRSCILVSMGGKNIMLDCGLHPGYYDSRRFPYFDFISKNGHMTEIIDCVLISHFHLDHCGALPYFTEVVGYDGPIYMTHPTKAILPHTLISSMQTVWGATPSFSKAQVEACMAKTTGLQLHQSVFVDDDPDFEIKVYYAGHVLGACMFYVRVGTESIVYTGDFNMAPERHLGAAWIDKVQPDVLITESTYGARVRPSRRTREDEFLGLIHECVRDYGKVLITCMAMGRAQELCMLVDMYWERKDLTWPVYFADSLPSRVNHYYQLFSSWTSENIRESLMAERNPFDYKHIKPWDPSYVDQTGPYVVFAGPGNMDHGVSKHIFRHIASDEKNMIIMPGSRCSSGKLGKKLMDGKRKIKLSNGDSIPIKLQVEHVSFGAHADTKGIMRLISYCEPRNVVLVHGDKNVMFQLSSVIQNDLGLPCLCPANGETLDLPSRGLVRGQVSKELLDDATKTELHPFDKKQAPIAPENAKNAKNTVETANGKATDIMAAMMTVPPTGQTVHVDGVLLVQPAGSKFDIKLVSHAQYKAMLPAGAQDPLAVVPPAAPRKLIVAFVKVVRNYNVDVFGANGVWAWFSVLHALYAGLAQTITTTEHAAIKVAAEHDHVLVGNVRIMLGNPGEIVVKWPLNDTTVLGNWVADTIANIVAGKVRPQDVL